MPLYMIPRAYGKIEMHKSDTGIPGVHRYLLSDSLKKHREGGISDGLGQIEIADAHLENFGGHAKIRLTLNTFFGNSYSGTLIFNNPMCPNEHTRPLHLETEMGILRNGERIPGLERKYAGRFEDIVRKTIWDNAETFRSILPGHRGIITDKVRDWIEMYAVPNKLVKRKLRKLERFMR